MHQISEATWLQISSILNTRGENNFNTKIPILAHFLNYPIINNLTSPHSCNWLCTIQSTWQISSTPHGHGTKWLKKVERISYIPPVYDPMLEHCLMCPTMVKVLHANKRPVMSNSMAVISCKDINQLKTVYYSLKSNLTLNKSCEG